MHFPTPVRKHALGSIVAYINQLFFLDSLASILPGGQSGEVTPVPIPNTEVKSTNGEGTVGVAHGRVARCQAFFIRARTIHLVRALPFLPIHRDNRLTTNPFTRSFPENSLLTGLGATQDSFDSRTSRT